MLLSILLQAAAGAGLGKLGAALGGDIRTNMIIIAALVEGVAIIAIIVCLLTLFL